jgi:hypothetical protein
MGMQTLAAYGEPTQKATGRHYAAPSVVYCDLQAVLGDYLIL